MDYRTVIRCFVEMKRDGCYAFDVSQLLIEEVASSNDITASKRQNLLQKIHEWQVVDEVQKCRLMISVSEILEQEDGFKQELAKFVSHCLCGGSTETF